MMTCAPRNEHLGVFIPARRRVEPEAFERSKPIEPKPAGAKAEADRRRSFDRAEADADAGAEAGRSRS